MLQSPALPNICHVAMIALLNAFIPHKYKIIHHCPFEYYVFCLIIMIFNVYMETCGLKITFILIFSKQFVTARAHLQASPKSNIVLSSCLMTPEGSWWRIHLLSNSLLLKLHFPSNNTLVSKSSSRLQKRRKISEDINMLTLVPDSPKYFQTVLLFMTKERKKCVL